MIVKVPLRLAVPRMQPLTFTRGETVSQVNFGTSSKKPQSTTPITVVTTTGETAGPLDLAIVDILRVLDPTA